MKYRVAGCVRNKNKIYLCDELIIETSKEKAIEEALKIVKEKNSLEEPKWEWVPEVLDPKDKSLILKYIPSRPLNA